MDVVNQVEFLGLRFFFCLLLSARGSGSGSGPGVFCSVSGGSLPCLDAAVWGLSSGPPRSASRSGVRMFLSGPGSGSVGSQQVNPENRDFVFAGMT